MSLKDYLFDVDATKERYVYLDILRILGCAAIVMVHVTQSLVMSPGIETGKWLTGCTYYAMSDWAIQVFFMISGALILSQPEQEVTHFLKKRAIRILPPFIVWTAIYLFIVYQDTILQGQLPPVRTILNVFASPAYSHLWFLYTIVCFYLWAPVFQVFVQKAPKKVIEYILIVGLVSTNVYLLVQHYYGMNIKIIVWIFDIPGFFILGYYLHKYDLRRKWRRLIYFLTIVSIPLMVFLTYLERDNYDGYFIYRWSPFLFIVVVGIFVYVKRIEWEKCSEKWVWFSKVTITGGILSFGVYLIHPIVHMLFNDLSWNVAIDGFLFHQVISIPIVTAGITLISFAACWGISKIPLVRRIIGA